MKGSLVVLLMFVGGCVAGMLGLVPEWLYGGDVTRMVLYVLLFCVGLGIGSREDLPQILKSISPRVVLLPLVTVCGTLAVSALVVIFLPARSLPEGLAVGAGMGYYSLSSILIAEYAEFSIGAQAAAELAAVALLANVFRELFTIAGAPLLARAFGPLAPIASGGATAMDVTLPSILRASGDRWLAASVISGILCDFSVPFLVSFFCSLM